MGANKTWIPPVGIYCLYKYMCVYTFMFIYICVFYGGNDSGSGTMSREPLYSYAMWSMQVVLFAEWMKYIYI